MGGIGGCLLQGGDNQGLDMVVGNRTRHPWARLVVQTFEALGTAPWAERARRELRASGETVKQAGDRTDQLTAQELQVARMAAEGLSNRQIAERLYMSHRTVASHLYRIFPKLGISSRAQLIPLSLDLPAAGD